MDRKIRKEVHLLPTAAAPKVAAGSDSTSQSGVSDDGSAAAAKAMVSASVASSCAVHLAGVAISGRGADPAARLHCFCAASLEAITMRFSGRVHK